jgi:hypothetical protein
VSFNVEEVKKLGAPFSRAEIHISARQKFARLILIIDETNNTSMDFEVSESVLDPLVEAAYLMEAAFKAGLLTKDASCSVLNDESAYVD